jgi:alpha-tubulin suppressor-like RCC1 family protein
MPINITQLTTDLETRLNNLGIETPEEILSLTAALNNLTSNRFISVALASELPSLTTNSIPSGSLVFVEQFSVLLMSVGTQWVGLDGRVPSATNTLYAWGLGGSGQLGDNTYTNRSSPVTVAGGISGWSQVSGGGYFTIGLRIDGGAAYGWGANAAGQLGVGDAAARGSPTLVIGGITNWSQVSAGHKHTLGRTSTGIAYAWGYNNFGELGDNTASTRSSPVTIVGGITNWDQLSAGYKFSLGTTSSGVLYAWGYNGQGQLGNNTTTSRSSPVTVIGGITTWNNISGGGKFSSGITSSGVLYAWGYNNSGQLGDDTTTARSSPVTVVGGITTWSKVGLGLRNSIGNTSAGIAYGWGGNATGQLGDNTTVAKSSPVTVVGGITNWSQVYSGILPNVFGPHGFSLGLTNAGIAYAWGGNETGGLGDGTTTSRSSPVTVIGGVTTWTQLSAGKSTYVIGYGAHSLGIAT